MAFEEEENQPAKRTLEELSNSDYEIREGEPDITGWNVVGSSGIKVGEVSDLLFDAQAQKVRYLIVELQASEEHEISDEDKRVLVPIGLAELSTDEETLTIPIGSAEELAGLPAYQTGELDPQDEVLIREVFGGSTAPYEQPQFYAHEHFNDDKFYNRAPSPDNNTIIAAEDMEEGGSEARAEYAHEIVNRLNHSDEEPASTEFPQGKIVGEYEAAGEENVNAENNDFQLNEGFIPEPESVEQEEAWQDEQAADEGTSKLMEFFVNELKDLLWAERELVETLPDMADAATSEELKNAFEMHLSETVTHVTRLEQIFNLLGLEPESRKCDAMAGIIDEGDEIISATEEGTAQRDVGLIFAGQKAEHYEIASYGGMIALATTLEKTEIAEILKSTLDEEKLADAKLTEIAEDRANHDAGRELADD
ncbi:DUF892 family protein [Mucilaginibacter corticis]|uniref:DUF892 family protein n=1 Tax=Mucilaginibacter corticis TaxID=2597670 RepID=A0A556M9B5_9SPHI|nr:DUF892 family protein [Mucilaginibacter corticis]TSJ36461.1 DUF892 family protein [Mucilaginibacter corticis]